MVLMGTPAKVQHENTFDTSPLPTAPNTPPLGATQRKAFSPPSSIQSDLSSMDGEKTSNKRKVKQSL
jgi:hypothetical protein